MLVQKITYPDFEGEMLTEDFYFNISRAELAELDLANNRAGGFQVMLQRVIDAKDGREIISVFKEIIRISYGKRAPDGRGFLKSDEISSGFFGTEAYSQLFMKIVTDPGFAAEFVNGLMPADLDNGNLLGSEGAKVVSGPAKPQDRLPKKGTETQDPFENVGRVQQTFPERQAADVERVREATVQAHVATDEEQRLFEQFKAERAKQSFQQPDASNRPPHESGIHAGRGE